MLPGSSKGAGGVGAGCHVAEWSQPTTSSGASALTPALWGAVSSHSALAAAADESLPAP